jgi:hypothetical protein
MKWAEIQQHYPHQWLLVEAVEAHSIGNRRILEDLAVLGVFSDSAEALRRYKHSHHQSPERELYVLHTDRQQLIFEERHWLGLRGVT